MVCSVMTGLPRQTTHLLPGTSSSTASTRYQVTQKRQKSTGTSNLVVIVLGSVLPGTTSTRPENGIQD